MFKLFTYNQAERHKYYLVFTISELQMLKETSSFQIHQTKNICIE